MTALEPIARETVIAPLDTMQVQMAMNRYQDGLKSILAESDYQKFADRHGEVQKFPKRSAWRKIAYWFNLDLELIAEDIERDGRGEVIRAKVKARALAPNGRYADGDGGCSVRERRFSKPEHDIPATAATRAMNRAISNLVGMGEVSAEEMEGEEATVHRYGPPASNRDEDNLCRAVEFMFDMPIPPELVERLAKDAGGYIPKIVARAVQLVAAQRPIETGSPPPPEPEPDPDVEPEKEAEEPEPEPAPEHAEE